MAIHEQQHGARKTRAEIIAAGRKCGCGKLATRQTVRGEEAESANHHPANFGYYCDKCFDEGLALEHEAMYGNERYF